MTYLRRLGHAVLDVDWAPVSLVAALRCGAMVTVLLAWGVATDEVAPLIAGAIGILFVCVADPPGPEGRRIRTMAWFALWSTLATLVGGLAADTFVVHLVVGVAVAAIAGYGGAAGPTGQVIGMLSLVVFAVFSGTPVAMDVAGTDALVYGAGALVGGVVIALPGLRSRARGPRGAFTRLARGLGHARVLDPLSAGAAVHATREREFLEAAAADRPAPEAAVWFDALAAAAHQARLGTLGLAVHASDAAGAARTAVVGFLEAAAACWRAAATTTAWPARRPTLARARTALDAAAATLRAGADPTAVRLAADVQSGLDAIADTLLAPWPVGIRTGRLTAPRIATAVAARWAETRHRIVAHAGRSDPLVRHAVRLAVVFGVAIALSQALDLPHPYWLPMTVAWISRPGQGNTTVRVAARVAGTVVGVLVSGLVVLGLDPGPWALVGCIGLSAVLAISFLAANYAIAVTGITTFVFFLFTLAGEPVGSSLSSRLLATVLAGILVVLAALIWPTRTGTAVSASLGDYAAALAAYAGPTLAGTALLPDAREVAHGTVLDARTRAVTDLHAAEFEIGARRLHPETAHSVLEALHRATALCLATELAGATADDRAAAAAVRTELVDLQTRLTETDTGRGVPARDHPPGPDHAVHRAVRRAHTALDADAAQHARA